MIGWSTSGVSNWRKRLESLSRCARISIIHGTLLLLRCLGNSDAEVLRMKFWAEFESTAKKHWEALDQVRNSCYWIQTTQEIVKWRDMYHDSTQHFELFKIQQHQKVLHSNIGLMAGKRLQGYARRFGVRPSIRFAPSSIQNQRTKQSSR
jgi:hypothetical protein